MKPFPQSRKTLALVAFIGLILPHSAPAAFFSSSDLTLLTNVTATGDIADGLKTLEVDNRLGKIRIVGVDAGPADWSWNLKVRARNATVAQQAVSKASCTAERTGDRLHLVVSLPDTDGRLSLQSDLEIRAPRNVAVITKNAYGQTFISNVTGEADATSQSGSLELQSIGGKVRAQTSFATLRVRDVGSARLKNQNGSIQASEVRGALQAETSFATLQAREINGSVKLRNQNGSIEAVKIKGDADIKTSYAEVTVKGVTGDVVAHNQNGRIAATDLTGAVEAITSYGALDIEGAGPAFECRNNSGSVKLHATSTSLTNLVANTSYGSMEIRLASKLNPAIQAHTTYGNLKSDFPLRPKAAGKTLAAVAPGTPRIRLENQSGSIRVLRD